MFPPPPPQINEVLTDLPRIKRPPGRRSPRAGDLPSAGAPGGGGGRGGAHRGPQEARAELRSHTAALLKPEEAQRPRAAGLRCPRPRGQRTGAAGRAVRGAAAPSSPPAAGPARPGGLHKGRQARPAGESGLTGLQGRRLPPTGDGRAERGAAATRRLCNGGGGGGGTHRGGGGRSRRGKRNRRAWPQPARAGRRPHDYNSRRATRPRRKRRMVGGAARRSLRGGERGAGASRRARAGA